MKIISRKALRLFWERHGNSEVALKVWYKRVEKARWKNLNNIKVDFSSVDFAGNDRFIFNIKGNTYRLIAKIDFDYQLVFIKFIGTHAEYDKIIDPRNI